MSESSKSGPSLPDAITEVRGHFASDAALQDALAKLTLLGFDRAELSVPAAHPDAATPEMGAQDPNSETDQRQVRTLSSSAAAAAGAMLGAGVVVATGGVAAVAVAAAAGLGLASGGVTYAAVDAADATNHAGREAAAASGELMLAALARDAGQSAKAEAAMREAGATEVRTVRRAA
jgi:hypothetical protein